MAIIWSRRENIFQIRVLNTLNQFMVSMTDQNVISVKHLKSLKCWLRTFGGPAVKIFLKCYNIIFCWRNQWWCLLFSLLISEFFYCQMDVYTHFHFPLRKNTNHKTLFSQYGKQQNHKEMFIINVLGKQRSCGVVCEF